MIQFELSFTYSQSKQFPMHATHEFDKYSVILIFLTKIIIKKGQIDKI
jgi:hypothetical protein